MLRLLSGALLVALAAPAGLAAPRRPSVPAGRAALTPPPTRRTEARGTPGFTRHVQPLLGKLGCANRACHGSFQGRGGFRLSLFSSDPKLDHENLLARARTRPGEVSASPVLRKPTAQEPHAGGKRMALGGPEYRLLAAWLAAGAPYQAGEEARVVRLEVTPRELRLAPGRPGRLSVRAHLSDGAVEEVTDLTQFSSNNDGVAAVTAEGGVKGVAPGDTAIVVVYGGRVETAPVLVPYPGARPEPISFPLRSSVDGPVLQRLRQLNLPPSPLTDDPDFLRRVSLDLAGTLPTPAEIRAFLADRSPDKRTRKVDELLARPAHWVWWTTRLCDQTGLNAPLFLGNTEFGPLVGNQWHAWLERRVRENVGYDRIVEGIVLATSRRPDEEYDTYSLRLSSYVRKQDPVDFTAEARMPHFWFRGNLKEPEEKALAFAYTFLGVRLDCAQCHKHPFDVWTQPDFQQFTALFERVRAGVSPTSQPAYQRLYDFLQVAKMKDAAERRQTYWRWAGEGRAVPWPEVYVAEPLPGRKGRLLGGAEVDLATVPDPRVPLMEWLRAPENPYFARAFVNRVWAYYFGRGLVAPTDDLNRANAPSHPELLETLTRGFVRHGYNMKWLHREIVTSHTYQLSWQPTAANRSDDRNLSRARLRPLPAEIAVDALLQATGNHAVLDQAATRITGRRIGVQATADEARTEFGLVVFGKPLRKTNCDCEREQDPSLQQALYLRNDQDLHAALDRKDGWLAELPPDAEPGALVEEAYLRTLSRLPTPRERERSLRHLMGEPQRKEALRDLLWALLNTQEFITNH